MESLFECRNFIIYFIYTMDSSKIQNALQWRYATKLFDVSKMVSDEDVNSLLEAARLAPSSLGLAPWKAYVVTNKDVREKLKSAAWNQPQISDASHLIIFAARKTVDESYVDLYLKRVMEVRNQKKEDVVDYKKMLMGAASKTPGELKAWNARQTYIALGFLLEAAAMMKIDACPMEGFDVAQFDTILGLDATEYTSVAIAAVGYRSKDDKYALAPKVRFEKKDMFAEI